jgi:protein involved in polysaccharide export with SLBB domain
MRSDAAQFVALLLLAGLVGCQSTHPHHVAALNAAMVPPSPEMPRELSKVALPIYTIEPPDILVVEALNIVPKFDPAHPYALRIGDVVNVNVANTGPNPPIAGGYQIGLGGNIDLGPPYGQISIAGLTLEQAKAKIAASLNIMMPIVQISLLEIAGKQQIAGQHLVGPDGTVTLGSYGSVSVVGLTISQAKLAIETHLRQFLENPEVAVDVFAYNSKVYYVITEGAGLGDGVTRFPVTGNETVLDAIANISGLTEVSSKRIWIARPVPGSEHVQVLPVDWQSVTALGASSTNYQIMPGDRIFVAEDKLVAFDTNLAKVLAPLERAMGFTLLSTGTATRLSGRVLRGGGNPGNGGGFSGP